MTHNIIKRDGTSQPFDPKKIEKAILKAFKATDGEITEYAQKKAENIAAYIQSQMVEGKSLTIDEIQDMVENGLERTRRKDVAKNYIIYRHERDQARGNLTDNEILTLLVGENDYWKNENSNKNSEVVSVQRDYLAGISSTDIAKRYLLPKEVVEAHNAGIIHQHDMDYMAQNALNNCCLINLEDMLQNGTIINGVMIEPQHTLLTAATVATQIITAVASSQYGGCTISLTHLAPYVRMSYERHLKDAKTDFEGLKEEEYVKVAKNRLNRELESAVQTFNYQINSMSTTNGQAPFLSVMMYMNETEEYKKELSMLIEEFLRQRILGMKNEKGVYVTPAFPKLLYVLEEDNITPDGKYYYLTELAATCTAKRMVPDYISELVMKRLKSGDVYPCMGKRKLQLM